MRYCKSFAALSLSTLFSLPLVASGQQSWTMTSVFPDSIGLIEPDKYWVELVNQIASDDLVIEFRSGGTLMPSMEVFDAASVGSIEAAGDWPGYWAGVDSAFAPLGTTTTLFNAIDYHNWIFEWGGWDIYQEIYGQYDLVYLPYGLVGSESGFMGRTPIKSLSDFHGKRVRLSGRDQGTVISELGASQVTLTGSEIYQAVERGVVDVMEFNTPGVDFDAGFSEVVDHWTSPGWHQTGSVLGVMINKEAWDELSEPTQQKLKLAARATMSWSLSMFERKASEGVKGFLDAGVEIHKLSEEELNIIQGVASKVMLESACENPNYAMVYHSMVSYLDDYSTWVNTSSPFNIGIAIDELPSLEEIEACL